MGLIPPETMRIDKWLWAARFFKTRAEAQRLVASGRLRLDGDSQTPGVQLDALLPCLDHVQV